MPASTRVHEASLIARLIGRLETEHKEMVYAHIGASRRCPTETITQQQNCTTMSSMTAHLSHVNCSNFPVSQKFNNTATSEESVLSVAMVTSDALSEIMETTAVWDRLSEKLRNFLQSHAANTVNASAYVMSGNYSTAVDELMSLLPVAPHDVILPQQFLCINCETALFASVSGLFTLASAQHATRSQCLLGHVFYACGHMSAVERFYFRSNWSRVESYLRDVRYCYSDSTSQQLYADTIECPQQVFAAIASSIEQSRGCTTTDDIIRWYSACEQMLSSTNHLMESLIARCQNVLAAAWQRCVLEVVVYTFLICVQVWFSLKLIYR